MIYHITSDGKQIAIQNLTTEHLKNIINWIEKKAEEGVLVSYDPYLEALLKGEDAKRHFNYSVYINELNRRKELIGNKITSQDIVEIMRQYVDHEKFDYYMHENQFNNAANAILDLINKRIDNGNSI